MIKNVPHGRLFIILGILIVILVAALVIIKNTGERDISGRDDDAPGIKAFLNFPELIEEKYEKTAVVWQDAELERLIREMLSRPEGDIYAGDLENITELHIWGNELEPGSADDIIAAAEKFTDDEIRAARAGRIESIQDLKFFKNLSRLTLCHQNIKDYLPLKDLTRLEYLVLTNNGISSTDFLRSLNGLISLKLDYNNIESLKDIGSLNNLKLLDISHNAISEIAGLNGISGLETLILNQEGLRPKDYVRLEDISALKSLTNLKKLSLRGQDIEDITVLNDLKSLVELDLRHNNIWDYTPLKDLKSLSILWIKGAGYHTYNLAFLRALPNLKTTDLDDYDWKKINYPFNLTKESAIEGIHPGNLVNGGFAGFDGKNIYYEYITFGDLPHPYLVAFNNEYLIENSGLSGVLTEQISDLTGQKPGGVINESISFLNVYKGKLYFVSRGHNNDTAMPLEDGIYYPGDEISGLMRMNRDGSERIILSSEPYSDINVINDKLYSLNKDAFPTVMNLDGSNKTILINEPCSMLYVNGKGIYYQKSDSKYIYKVNLDGSDPELIIDFYCIYPIILESRILYLNEKQNICEYDISQKQTRILYENPVKHINISEQYLVFSTDDGLFRADKEGKNIIQLHSGYSDRICVIGDYIFFDTIDGYCKIKNDGTEYTEYFEYY